MITISDIWRKIFGDPQKNFRKSQNGIDIANIETKYRTIPFWSWNDKLECSVLREQIRQMHAAGIGGFFMHARGGLQTEYLSEEWIECIKACLDEARQLGMEAWLYDENGWPSGFGGGTVNGKGGAYQQKYLRMEEGRVADLGSENTIAYYTTEGRYISRETPGDPAMHCLRCYFEVNPYYVDNLDPAVVKAFLQSTHEFYYKHLSPELLPYLKGIFTDEPQLSRNGCVWSFVLEEAYQKEYGRDLLIELPQLLRNLGDFRQTRIRFWRLVAKKFNESFMKQVSAWCHSHNWFLTGHHVLEEYFHWQIPSNGAIMPQYEFYDIPGMDHLGRIPVDPLAMTQLVSASMQFGKKQILTESFALTGWNFNFSGMHWIFNQQLAHGVNLLCQHLQGYSLRGLRKRDYPSSNFVHQPWWEEYKLVNDTFARAGKLLAEGRAHTDVAVVHPISTCWTHFTGDSGNGVIGQYTNALKELTVALDSAQIPHHYADEMITEKIGSVRGNSLSIGQCCYHTVIIPPLTNLSLDMTRKLMAFSAAGGRILKVKNPLEELPLTVDGEKASADVLKWFGGLAEFSDNAALVQELCASLPDLLKVSGSSAGSVLSTSRTFGRDKFYFITNKEYEKECRVRLELPCSAAFVNMIDGESGKLYSLKNVLRQNGKMILDHTFSPGEALMLYLSDDTAGEEEISLPDLEKGVPVRCIDTLFQVKSATPGNIITLDHCRYRVDSGNWEQADFCVIHPRLLDLGRPCQLEMESDFEVDDSFDLDMPLSLIVETPEKFEFSLNGVPFEGTSTGTVFDQAFHRVLLPHRLQRGVNTIGLKCRYAQSAAVYESLPKARMFETEYNKLVFDSEIENIYLLGDFSVKFHGNVEELEHKAERLNGTFILSERITGKEISCDDVVLSGLPFFAGKLHLVKTVELRGEELDRIDYLQFTPLNGNSYQLIINGKAAPLLYHNKYAIKVSEMLQPGSNTLEVIITTSLRNMLGPHHLQIGESFMVDTLSFTREPNSLQRYVHPSVDGYCFVKLGMKDIKFLEITQ